MIESEKDITPGFSRKRPAKDNWAGVLRIKHGLSEDASLEEIETTATRLLGDPRTVLSGAELVLGRRVDAQDKEVPPIIMTPGFSPEERFGLLLLQLAVDDARNGKAKQ